MEMVNPRSTLPVCNANAGVREDKFNEFLTMNNLALQTVMAGGIFSIGGMTSYGVHGGTIYVGIFAETCVSFSIMKYDGTIETIDVESKSSIRSFSGCLRGKIQRSGNPMMRRCDDGAANGQRVEDDLKDGNSLAQSAHEECRYYFKHHVVTYFEADLLSTKVLPFQSSNELNFQLCRC